MQKAKQMEKQFEEMQMMRDQEAVEHKKQLEAMKRERVAEKHKMHEVCKLLVVKVDFYLAKCAPWKKHIMYNMVNKWNLVTLMFRKT